MPLPCILVCLFVFGFANDIPKEDWPSEYYLNVGTLGHVLEPAEGDGHTGTLIWFHGFDETANHWIDIMREIQEEVPGLKIVLPTAEPRRIMATGQPGILPKIKPAWFDLIDRFGYYGMPYDREDSTGMRMTRAWIRNLIRDELSHSKIPSEKVVLGGFDMGGTISIFTGLTFERKLAGVIGVASWIPLQGRIKLERTKENEQLPIALCHGKEDIIVPYMHTFPHSERFLKETNQPYETSSYDFFKHYWTQPMQDDTIKYLKKFLNAKGKSKKSSPEPQKPSKKKPSSTKDDDDVIEIEIPTIQTTIEQTTTEHASTHKTKSVKHEDL